MLNSNEIQTRSLVEDAEPSAYRRAGYDSTVGAIVDSNGQEHESFILKPGGVVEVVSAERIHLPDDVCGYAFVKTSLCDEGVLALNIGIIDPGYRGPLSTTLVNFGSQGHLVSPGDPFLRLSFHEFVPHEASGSRGDEITNREYLQKKRDKAIKNFGDLFLNVESVADAAAESVLGRYRKFLLWWAPVAGLFIAFLSYLAVFLANYDPISRLTGQFEPLAASLEQTIQARAKSHEQEVAVALAKQESRMERFHITQQRDRLKLERVILELEERIGALEGSQ